MKTSIDWTPKEALLAADPFLAWAELTEYKHFRLPFTDFKWWVVLIELHETGNVAPIDALVEKADKDWLQISSIYTRNDIKAKKFQFCTARVSKDFFVAVASGSLKDLVRRYQICLPVEYPAEGLNQYADQVSSLEGWDGQTIIALIDGGLAVGNSAFLNKAGKSRIRHFWRQDDYSGSRYLRDTNRTQRKLPSTPPWEKCMMGYGAELTRQGLDDAIQKHSADGPLDESGLYQDLGLWELDRLMHHGTHVFGLAAGPFLYPQQFCDDDQSIDWTSRDVASTCDLMVVQLAWANVLDTTGLSSYANILDALMYLYARCPDKARLIVNISWGGHAGSHDGSSILDKAMQAWCGLREPNKLQIVLSAGNSYHALGHADSVIERDTSWMLPWRVPPESYTPHFLELWFEAEQMKSVEITVEAPGPLEGKTLAVSRSKPHATLPGVATLILVNRSYLGEGTMALLVLSPTAGDRVEELAAAGLWKVTVKNSGDQSLKVDAFIERNDVALGLFTGARQSYFEDVKYNEYESVDIPPRAASVQGAMTNQSDIRRTGSFSSIATGSDGKNIFSVGASVQFPVRVFGGPLPASYSPRLDDSSTDRVRRGKVKNSPDCIAPGDERVGLWGLRGAGSRSGAVVRLGGTSVSAAQVVRTLANNGDPLPSPKLHIKKG